MKISTLCALGLGVGFALACTGGTTAPEVVTPPPPPPPVVVDGAINVLECDDYIKKMEECLSKMDATTRPAHESSFKSTREAWTVMAATPEGKASLPMVCSATAQSLSTIECDSAAAKAAADKEAEEKAAKEKADAEPRRPLNPVGSKPRPSSRDHARPGTSGGSSSGTGSTDHARPK